MTQLKTNRLLAAGALLALLGSPASAKAWLYHEHAGIGQQALDALSPQERLQVAQLWAAVLPNPKGERLCGDYWGNGPDCLGFATLASIAGDHSCSPSDLWISLSSDWLLAVMKEEAWLAPRMRRELAQGKTDALLDSWHSGNLQLYLKDPKFLSRAKTNDGHFALLRITGESYSAYVSRSVHPGVLPNAVGLYVVYHAAALKLAQAFSKVPFDDPKRNNLARWAVTTEAFALHFLEDMFASGHLVGSRGIQTERIGTHDYYSEHGLQARTWRGDEYIAHGDAFLMPSDLRHSAKAVTESIRQLASVAAGQGGDILASIPACAWDGYALDVCQQWAMPGCVQSAASSPAFARVLTHTPIAPSGEWDLPRYRTEAGSFFRFSGAARGGLAFGGYNTPDPIYVPRGHFGMELGVGLGLGAEGVTTRSSDGLFFIQGSLLSYSAQRSQWCVQCSGEESSLIPRRWGYGFRIRMPYWALPGDLLYLGLPVGLISPQSAKHMFIESAEGGALGLNRVHTFSGGMSYQMVLGREVGLTFFGRYPSNYHNQQPFRSVELDLPVIEFRPTRLYAARLANSLVVQSGLSLDFSQEFSTASILYLKIGFDGRYYF